MMRGALLQYCRIKTSRTYDILMNTQESQLEEHDLNQGLRKNFFVGEYR